MSGTIEDALRGKDIRVNCPDADTAWAFAMLMEQLELTSVKVWDSPAALDTRALELTRQRDRYREHLVGLQKAIMALPRTDTDWAALDEVLAESLGALTDTQPAIQYVRGDNEKALLKHRLAALIAAVLLSAANGMPVAASVEHAVGQAQRALRGEVGEIQDEGTRR